MSSTLSAMRSIKGIQLGPEFARAAADIQLAQNNLNGLNNGMQNFSNSSRNATRSAGDGFTVMKGLAVQAIMAIIQAGKQMVSSFLTFGDQMAGITARLSNVIAQTSAMDGTSVTTGVDIVQNLSYNVDNTQAVSAAQDLISLQDQIFASSQRSYTSFLETADAVSKIATNAGDAFASTQEIITFSELLNKSFQLGGASASEQAGAVRQLTQALASGVLRGDEFNSIAENAPLVYEAIAKYMDLSKGEVRALASDGELTADVVRMAMFAAADDINSKFATLPMTLGKVAQNISGQFQYAFGEMAIGFNQFVGEQLQEGMTWLINNFDEVASAAVIAGTALAAVGATVAIMWLIANWPVLAVIAGIVLLISIVQSMGLTFEETLTGVGAIFGWLYAVITNGIAIVWNAIIAFVEFFVNVFVDPIGSVQRLFISVFSAILGVIETVAGAIGSLFGQDWSSGIAGLRTQMEAFADTTYGTGAMKLERMELTDVGSAAKAGAAFGANAGDKISSGIEKLQGAMAGGVGGAGDLGDAITNTSQGKAVKTKNTDKLITEEDIRMLTDIATRDYKLQYQQITPQVTMTFGDIRETADADGIIERLATTIEELASSKLAVVGA